MSKQEEAGLILKLYELRREDTMRKARDWYFREFNPQSLEDLNKAMFSEHSGHLRMVITYWEMAAALVNNGAIGLELFSESNCLPAALPLPIWNSRYLLMSSTFELISPAGPMAQRFGHWASKGMRFSSAFKSLPLR